MWAKLVNLNTVHWYCDGPEPTTAAIKYEERTRQRKFVTFFFYYLDLLLSVYPSTLVFTKMDDAKRRAAIRSKAAKNKETDVGAMGRARAGPWRRDRCLRSTMHPRNRKFRRSPS